MTHTFWHEVDFSPGWHLSHFLMVAACILLCCSCCILTYLYNLYRHIILLLCAGWIRSHLFVAGIGAMCLCFQARNWNCYPWVCVCVVSIVGVSLCHVINLLYLSNRVTASLVMAETELLSAVLRQHISVANSAPTPIIAAVNNIS